MNVPCSSHPIKKRKIGKHDGKRGKERCSNIVLEYAKMNHRPASNRTPDSRSDADQDLIEALTAIVISAEAYRRWHRAEGNPSLRAAAALRDIIAGCRRLLDAAESLIDHQA